MGDRELLELAAHKLRAHMEGMRRALELIAAPMRPDGTWNRDRLACQQLAEEALAKMNSEDA